MGEMGGAWAQYRARKLRMMMSGCDGDKSKCEYLMKSGVAYADVGDEGIEEGEREPILVFRC
jgi:hypothetical protein